MKEAPIVTLEIAPDGNVSIEVLKVQGPGCLALTNEVEQALGKVTQRTKKPECTQLGNTGQQQQIGGL